ncbi:MAG: zinc-ribbon domain-containing protein [Candidatus Korobacteraceae bacterium]|jgi:uncharacterized membrane protein
MARCPQCDWPLPEQAQYCSSCGTAIAPAVPSEATVAAAAPAADGTRSARVDGDGEALPIAENIAGVIAYMTIFPAIVFLLLEPFKRNRFVRFHSFQHLLLWAAGVVFGIASGIVGAILQLIPFMRVLVFPFTGLVGLAFFFLWVLLVVKAYNHEMFKLPILGDLAETWANR